MATCLTMELAKTVPKTDVSASWGMLLLSAMRVAAYSLATDWDINQVWAVIEPFLKKYERARISDLEKLIGSHVSEKQLRNYLEALRKDGRLSTEGKNKYLYYVLGKGE